VPNKEGAETEKKKKQGPESPLSGVCSMGPRQTGRDGGGLQKKKRDGVWWPHQNASSEPKNSLGNHDLKIVRGGGKKKSRGAPCQLKDKAL